MNEINTKKYIVEKIKERLKQVETLKPLFPETIKFFTNPFREIEESDLPCIKIAIMRGKAEEKNNAIEYEKTSTLLIVYQDSACNPLEVDGGEHELVNRLYEAEEIISAALITDENNPGDEKSLYHVVDQLRYSEWDLDLKKGSPTIGAIALKFDLKYHDKYLLSFNDFKGVKIKTQHTGVENEEDAFTVQDIEVPTE